MDLNTDKKAVFSGLVSRVVKEEYLDEEIKQITTAIKSKSKSVLALGKEFIYQQLQLPIEEAYQQGAEVSLY